MSKQDSARIDDTLVYLARVDNDLAYHLSDAIDTSAERETVWREVGNAISLGGKSQHADRYQSTNKDQRRALRALLLCQRVYLTPVWTGANKGTYAGFGDWPTPSLSHWLWRNESDICQGIQLYTITERADANALADVAMYYCRQSSLEHSYLVATRNSGNNFPSSSTCYAQISKWLLHAGFVSLRWIRKFEPSGHNFTSFGQPKVRIKKTDRTPDMPIHVPRGQFIHMYTDLQPGGHWMVSDGKGYGFGANNTGMDASAAEGKVDTVYCRCLIHRQFENFRHPKDLGQLDTFDPTSASVLPGRI